MPDHDRVEGAAKNIGGKIKEAAGKLTGDEKLKASVTSLRLHRSGRRSRRGRRPFHVPLVPAGAFYCQAL